MSFQHRQGALSRLCHRIHGVSMEEDRIQAVKNWPKLKSLREIQVFLGFANFYRRFIKGSSRLAAPLTEMIRQSSLSREGSSTRVCTSLTKMIRQSPSRDRGSERTVSVHRDVDTSSTPTAEMTRLSPLLRDTDSDRVVSVQRDTDASSTQSTEMTRQSLLRDTDSLRVVSVQRDVNESS